MASPKLFIVTQEQQVNKKTRKSKVIGFISVFGWESAEQKAAAKYPWGGVSIHEAPTHKRK